MQLVVCDDIHEITTNAKLIGKNLVETDVNALTRIFLVENIDFLEKYFDTYAWMAVKTVIKLYKNRFFQNILFKKNNFFGKFFQKNPEEILSFQ